MFAIRNTVLTVLIAVAFVMFGVPAQPLIAAAAEVAPASAQNLIRATDVAQFPLRGGAIGVRVSSSAIEQGGEKIVAAEVLEIAGTSPLAGVLANGDRFFEVNGQRFETLETLARFTGANPEGMILGFTVVNKQGEVRKISASLMASNKAVYAADVVEAEKNGKAAKKGCVHAAVAGGLTTLFVGGAAMMFDGGVTFSTLLVKTVGAAALACGIGSVASQAAEDSIKSPAEHAFLTAPKI